MTLILEKPRTLKDLSGALNLSKREVLSRLSVLPVEPVRMVDRSQHGPIVTTYYREA